MTDFSMYTIFQLLFALWDTYEEIKCINALISIDVMPSFLEQRRECYRTINELCRLLR